MNAAVKIETAQPRLLAAVRRRVRIGEVGAAWKPALDLVWAFLRERSELRRDGHNVFVYQSPAQRGLPMEVDFGVEVVQPFEACGEVKVARTPGGLVAMATHVGPYGAMRATHDAIQRWIPENGEKFSGTSWEIYGDWTEDESKLETRIEYLLK